MNVTSNNLRAGFRLFNSSFNGLIRTYFNVPRSSVGDIYASIDSEAKFSIVKSGRLGQALGLMHV